MKINSLLLFATVPLLCAGCSSHPAYRYYAAPPPPPPPPAYRAVPPMVQMADREGYRAGYADGGRDAYERHGYRPQAHRTFHDTPGYDPGMGPYPPYRDSFRSAYERGYSQGYGPR